MRNGLLLIIFLLILPDGFSQVNRSFNTLYTEPKVEVMPAFPGGDQELFQRIMEQIHPNPTMTDEVGSGTSAMYMSFTIDSDGNLSDLDLHECEHLSVERELERIMSQSPAWKPASDKGKPVSTKVYVPIVYKIEDGRFIITNKGTELAVLTNTKKNKGLKWTLLGGAFILMGLIWLSTTQFFN
ncbi:MAG: hypothetical protein FJY10_06600 [Bacteroidetes bacterium]|nr:hypothetical protein [Bacteroidota bacterium]